jgi:hypothetical protein
MGQAKIRKKNGTYPTAAQIAQMEQERIRENTFWYPTADVSNKVTAAALRRLW